MDLNFNKPFILKIKKIKDVISFLNKEIEKKLKNSKFYEEDKEYFYFENVYLKIDSHLTTKDLNFNNISFYLPKLIILKGKKINNYYLSKHEWLILPYDIRDSYKSENKIYAFALL
jgi:hypothetical protein